MIRATTVKAVALLAIGTVAGSVAAQTLTPTGEPIPFKGVPRLPPPPPPQALVSMTTSYQAYFSGGLTGTVSVMGEGVSFGGGIALDRNTVGTDSRVYAHVSNHPAGSYRVRFTIVNGPQANTLTLSSGPITTNCAVPARVGATDCDLVVTANGNFTVTIGWAPIVGNVGRLPLKSVQVIKES